MGGKCSFFKTFWLQKRDIIFHTDWGKLKLGPVSIRNKQSQTKKKSFKVKMLDRKIVLELLTTSIYFGNRNPHEEVLNITPIPFLSSRKYFFTLAIYSTKMKLLCSPPLSLLAVFVNPPFPLHGDRTYHGNNGFREWPRSKPTSHPQYYHLCYTADIKLIWNMKNSFFNKSKMQEWIKFISRWVMDAIVIGKLHYTYTYGLIFMGWGKVL